MSGIEKMFPVFKYFGSSWFYGDVHKRRFVFPWWGPQHYSVNTEN